MAAIQRSWLRTVPDPDPAGGASSPAALAERDDAADRQAVGDVLDGDAEAFTPVVRRHSARVLSLCVRLAGDRHVGEELAQEALARAYTQLGAFRGDCRVRDWLLRIALNGCRDHLKARARVERPAVLTGDELPTWLDPERQAAGRQAVAALAVAVKALPVAQREAFVLFHLEGLSYQEMRVITGARVNALKVRVHRARATLRLALGDLLEADGR